MQKNTEYAGFNKELSARLMAVQALYESVQNDTSIKQVIQEHLERETWEDIDGTPLPKPQGVLFKRILSHVSERREDVDEIIHAQGDKEIEPLLKAVITCAVTELLVHLDIDTPLIINDYLNITHAFYAPGQASFVNGVLDNIAKSIR